MKSINVRYILFVGVLLLAARTYASPYGVQVPMSSYKSAHTSYRAATRTVQPSTFSVTRTSGYSVSRTAQPSSHSAAYAPQSSYRPSQTVINMSSTARSEAAYSPYGAMRPSGQFSTYVPSVDMYGQAMMPDQYNPAASGGYDSNPMRPRRVMGDGEDDEEYESADPYLNSYPAPVGDIPWLFMSVIVILYPLLKSLLSRHFAES